MSLYDPRRAATGGDVYTLNREGMAVTLMGRRIKYKTPFVLGNDVAGPVTRVGTEVRDYEVGDEVYARPRDLCIRIVVVMSLPSA